MEQIGTMGSIWNSTSSSYESTRGFSSEGCHNVAVTKVMIRLGRPWKGPLTLALEPVETPA